MRECGTVKVGSVLGPGFSRIQGFPTESITGNEGRPTLLYMDQKQIILTAYYLGRKDGLSKSKEKKPEELFRILGL